MRKNLLGDIQVNLEGVEARSEDLRNAVRSLEQSIYRLKYLFREFLRERSEREKKGGEKK